VAAGLWLWLIAYYPGGSFVMNYVPAAVLFAIGWGFRYLLSGKTSLL
jgi:hypothetical protein